MPPEIGQWRPLALAVGDGRPGVAMFFVISGFLITHLLLKELDRSGDISLKRFYFRRAFRIFPAFYVYMAAVGVLWALGIIALQPMSFAVASTYLLSLYGDARGYFIFHTWSLSVEEIFYLAWPAVLLRLGRAGASKVAWALIAAMPVVRIAVWATKPALAERETFLLYGWVDTLMAGSLLALWQGSARWNALRRAISGPVSLFLALAAFGLIPYAVNHDPTGVVIRHGFGLPLRAICMGGLLLYAVENSKSPVGAILNHRVIRHIGVISYSLYLWQQLFTAPQAGLFPAGILLMLAAAELSYWMVERPALRLRDEWEPRVFPAPQRARSRTPRRAVAA